MTLSGGTRLGPYEILNLLGSGGMGEVYKARDTRLDRTVAIKILPDALAADPQVRDRFDREARAISQLDHPHICALYDVGEQEGTVFLVMQYLKGEPLADRLQMSHLPLNETLTIAVQIADALDKAHRAGVVHGDLKPGNIFLINSGAKLVDFGVTDVAPDTATLGEESVLAGTIPYMAPEQLDGGTVDGRTDIFAFGIVLYEMLTKRRPFEGDGLGSLMGTIMSADAAPPSSLQANIPAALDRAVLQCLAKNPDDRWQTARDLKRQLQWIAADSATLPDVNFPPPRHRPRRRRWTAMAMAGTLLLVGAMGGAVALLRVRADEVRAIRFTVTAPEGATFSPSASLLALSPDGRQLAFLASRNTGPTRIWIRSLDVVAPRELAGSDGAFAPFWSPDGRFIGFFADGKLKTIDVAGGALRVLCEQRIDYPAGTWNRDGVIIFAPGPAGASRGFYRISAQGGNPAPIKVTSQPLTFHAPQFLPDGRHFIYYDRGKRPQEEGIYIGALDSSQRKFLASATSNPDFAAPRHLFFRRGETLFAQVFDPDRLEVNGEAVPIAADVAYNPGNGRTMFSVSQAGSLSYRVSVAGRPVLFDRTGHQIGLEPASDRDRHLALSPDGHRMAVTRMDPATGNRNIWIVDFQRAFASRVTSQTDTSHPVWSPDGRRIVFASRQGGRWGVYLREASGAGEGKPLLQSDADDVPLDWSLDGRVILFSRPQDAGTFKLFALPITPDKVLPPVELPFEAAIPGASSAGPAATLSPDSRWVAYVSNESGSEEIYVRPFSRGDDKWQVSTHGGVDPMWRRDGRELFYLAADGHMMAVSVKKTEPTLQLGTPVTLFETRTTGVGLAILGERQYGVTEDGQHFIVNQPLQRLDTVPITVVVNWRGALSRALP
jgi:Tol biopolymer transport system component